MQHALAAALPDRIAVNGGSADRLPNTLNVSIAGVVGHELLAATPGIAASTGSACHGIDGRGDHQPSPVLTAMGLPPERGLSALRLSLGRWSTADEIDRAAELIVTAARRAPSVGG